jgi:hypothetical protein
MAELPPLAQPYEPPRIERALTLEDLTCEILYAGPTTTLVDNP